MLTRGAKRKAREKKVNDRHYDNGDRHKKKGVDHHANKDSGHRCICGYDKCGEVREGFRGTGHTYDRRPICFKVPQPCEEWNDFFDSLVRNLHIPDEVVNHMGEGERI